MTPEDGDLSEDGKSYYIEVLGRFVPLPSTYEEEE